MRLKRDWMSLTRYTLLAMFAAALSAAPSWAIAEEEGPSGLEGFNALSVEGPLQISEASPEHAKIRDSAIQQQIDLVSGYIVSRNRSLPESEVKRIARAIVDYSARYGVDFRLLTSLISVESSFRRDAVSSSGAIGLGQLKPDTAKWLGVVDPYDPIDNIAGTARFLGWLVRKYNGDLESALSAYYQGPGFVDRNGVTSICVPYLEKINKALIGLI